MKAHQILWQYLYWFLRYQLFNFWSKTGVDYLVHKMYGISSVILCRFTLWAGKLALYHFKTCQIRIWCQNEHHLMRKAHFLSLKKTIILQNWSEVSYYILKISHDDHLAPICFWLFRCIYNMDYFHQVLTWWPLYFQRNMQTKIIRKFLNLGII